VPKEDSVQFFSIAVFFYRLVFNLLVLFCWANKFLVCVSVCGIKKEMDKIIMRTIVWEHINDDVDADDEEQCRMGTA